MCRLDDVTRPLYFRGNRLSLMFRVGRDGVLLLSGIGKRYSFGYGFSMKSEIVDWDERLIDTFVGKCVLFTHAKYLTGMRNTIVVLEKS